MIPLGDLYRVVIVVYLLQLYPNCSRFLKYINCDSPLEYLLGHLLGRFLRHPLKCLLGCFLGYPLEHYLVYLLKHLIKA